MSTPAVHCSDLSKRFGNVPAVRNVSFTLLEGSFLSLLGPSGCGKTSTLRLIAGFETPDSGSVEIAGKSVAKAGNFVPPEKRQVGMVFQDYALFPHISVHKNIAYGLPKKADNARRVDEMIELVGLTGFGPRFPHELSGGEQQRVALARALAPNPKVVLLDEPFSNLDATLRAKMRSEVKRILREVGTATVFVTHDQDEALSLAGQVGVMLDGKIAQIDSPETVYSRPASLQVASFLGNANIIDGYASSGVVESELGLLPVTQSVSGPVKVIVRPESIRIGPPQPGKEAAEVVDREFYGHDQVILVRMPSGQLIRCRCASHDLVRPGDSVALAVEFPLDPSRREAITPASLVVFPSTDSLD